MIFSILGYRSFTILPGLRLHPVDIFFFIYLLWVLISNKIYIFPKGLLYFFIIGLILLLNLKSDWNYFSDFEEFKGLISIIPVFILCSRIYTKNFILFKLFFVFCIACFVSSFLGLLEYYFPSATLFLLDSVNSNVPLSSGDVISNDFNRALFSFWGSPTVGHVLILSIPLFWLRNVNNLFQKQWIVTTLFVVILMGIYITGNRANWVQLFLLFIIYILFFKPFYNSFKRIFIYLIFVVFSFYFVLSNTNLEIFNRFLSVFYAVQGNADAGLDSSGLKRQQRYDDALSVIFESPFGNGWGSSGLVHSDILQLTANMGWVAGLIFVYLLIVPFYWFFRNINYFNKKSTEDVTILVLLSLQLIILLNFWRNAIYYLPQTGIYYFFFWGLLYFKLKHKTIKYNA
jgi:hypothetical protein